MAGTIEISCRGEGIASELESVVMGMKDALDRDGTNIVHRLQESWPSVPEFLIDFGVGVAGNLVILITEKLLTAYKDARARTPNSQVNVHISHVELNVTFNLATQSAEAT